MPEPEPAASGDTFLAFTGNCQSVFLASVFQSLPGVQAAYFGKLGRFIPFEGRSAPDYPLERLTAEVRARKAAGARVILCEQSWQLAPKLARSRLDTYIDGVVRFPNLEAFVLWPDRQYPPEQLSRLTPARMLKLDRATIAACCKDADVQMVEVFDALFRKHILFDTPRHPTGLLFSEMVSRLLATEALQAMCADPADLVARVAASRGINTVFNHPAPAETLDALGCEWGRTRVYGQWRSATEAIAARDMAGALHLIYALLQDEPDDPQFHRLIAPNAWARAAQIETSLGRIEAAREAQFRTMALDPENPARPLGFATHLSRLGRDAEALALIDGVIDRFPSHTPLMARQMDLRRTVGEAPADPSIFVAGQSLAAMFLVRGRKTFDERLRKLDPVRGRMDLWGSTASGSFAADTNRLTGRPLESQPAWWNMERDAPAPALDAALQAIAAENRPTSALFFDLGQHETLSATGRYGRETADVIADYDHAMRRTIGSLRAALRPESPDSLPVLLMPLGPRRISHEVQRIGLQAISACQARLFAELPNCHPAGCLLGMELSDAVHPSEAGITYYAREAADAVHRIILSGARLQAGPASARRSSRRPSDFQPGSPGS